MPVGDLSPGEPGGVLEPQHARGAMDEVDTRKKVPQGERDRALDIGVIKLFATV